MTHGGAHAAFDGTGIEPGVDPRYYLMPIGLLIGFFVVFAFEHFTAGWSTMRKKKHFKDLIHRKSVESMDDILVHKLSQCVDGPKNILHFWTGALLVGSPPNKEAYAKAFETLAVLCALMFAVAITLYVESDGDHLTGLVGCLANCCFWMNTMMSTFLAVAINACENNEQVMLLQGLYGRYLFRVPMILFAWGSFLIFVQFVLFFKLNIDPGFNCSMCLGGCLTLFPLFLHCLHKLGWASYIVHGEAIREKERAKAMTPDEVRARLCAYVAEKGQENVLNLDRDEFLNSFKVPGYRDTSVLMTFAGRIFNAYVEKQMRDLYNDNEFSCRDLNVGSQSSISSSEFSCPNEINRLKHVTPI